MATGLFTANYFLSSWETKDNYVSVGGFPFYEIQWVVKLNNNATLNDDGLSRDFKVFMLRPNKTFPKSVFC